MATGDRSAAVTREVRDPAALFVEPDSVYKRLGLDCWDEIRDARTYGGPGPVIAHPPCARWGRLFWTDGSKSPGNDGGLFAFAISALKKWGGVLEHPAGSFAWPEHGIARPAMGAWSRDISGIWSTEICQSAYGHRAEKRTWLAAHGPGAPPGLDWSCPPHTAYLMQPGRCSPGKPRRSCQCDRCYALYGTDRVPVERMGRRERLATPEPMACELIRIAKEVTHV